MQRVVLAPTLPCDHQLAEPHPSTLISPPPLPQHGARLPGVAHRVVDLHRPLVYCHATKCHQETSGTRAAPQHRAWVLSSVKSHASSQFNCWTELEGNKSCWTRERVQANRMPRLRHGHVDLVPAPSPPPTTKIKPSTAAPAATYRTSDVFASALHFISHYRKDVTLCWPPAPPRDRGIWRGTRGTSTAERVAPSSMP